MKKRVIFVIVLIVIVLIGAGFYFFYDKKCSTQSCFEGKMEKCEKAIYTDDLEDAAWQYHISPSFSCMIGRCNECRVNVRLLEVKSGTVELARLEGMDMDCLIPIQYAGKPQADLERCSGKLKEEMQYIIITKMHSYIVSNIGQVSEELNKVFNNSSVI